MAIQFVNPLTAGTVLIRSAIQSQNYAVGSAGWIVQSNGNAEFNNLTLRGTFQGSNYIINSSGCFFYSGTPANGNLIQSITNAAGTDAFGNAYNAGFSVYQGTTTEYLVDTSGNLTVGPATGPHFSFSVGASPTMKAFDTSGKLCLQLDSNSGLLTVLDNTDLNFIQLNTTTAQTPGGMVVGTLSAAGVMPTATQVAQGGGLYNLNGSSLGMHSPIGVPASFNTYAGTFLTSGQNAKTTGSGLNPIVQMYALPIANASDVDLHISGSVVKSDQSGSSFVWQTPSPFSANWTGTTTINGQTGTKSIQYRMDVEDNVRIVGAALSSGTGTIIFVLPAAYRPAERQIIPCYYLIGGVVTPGFVQVTAAGQVACSATISGVTIASGSQVFINGDFPLGNIS